jgi:hypothetical protein
MIHDLKAWNAARRPKLQASLDAMAQLHPITAGPYSVAELREKMLPPGRKVKIKGVRGRFDGAETTATVTIDRARQLFTVRPKHRRREYTLTLQAVCEMVTQKVLIAEMPAAPARARRVKRF